MPEVIFGLESYQSRSLPLSAQRMINAFFEKQPQGSKGQTPIFGAPGLTLFSALPEGPVRQMWQFNSAAYAIAGQSLYRVQSSGGFKKIGSGIAGTNVCSMSDNGQQIIMVNGVGGWFADLMDNFTEIEDTNFQSAATVRFFDDYFVFDRRDTNEFFLSSLEQAGPPYNALLFASAEAQPGFLLAIFENLQLLFLMCSKHIEMWYDAGTAPFPFQRYAGGVIEFGCAGALSSVKQDGAIFFLGNDKVFYRLQGNVPIRVSNHGVEHAINSWPRLDDAHCFTYTIEGHKMVHLTSPSAKQSFVFDISTQMWHERVSVDAEGNNLGRWRGNCALECYDKVLIGDYQNGNIYSLDWTNYTENGLIMPFEIHSQTLQADKRRLFINRLELDMEQGEGLTLGQGSMPFAFLQYSKDGGRKWSTIQPGRNLGRIGQTVARQRWLALGQAYQWTFRLLITDAVPRVLIATHLDAAQGAP